MATSPVLPKLVGERVKRREDPRLIQGRGTYVDDLAVVGMRHLAFKRSDVAHGQIRSIDTKLPNRWTASKRSSPAPRSPNSWRPCPSARRSLPRNTVRLQSTRSDTRRTGRGRRRARSVSRAGRGGRHRRLVRQLPAVVDVEQAMTGQPTVIHPAFPNNLAVAPLTDGTGVSESGSVDDAAMNEAFAKANVVISQRMVNQRLAPTCDRAPEASSPTTRPAKGR